MKSAGLAGEFYDGGGVCLRSRQESIRATELDRRYAAILACNSGKMDAVEQLLAGRTSLLKAAASFESLDLTWAGRDEAMFHARFAGRTEAECYCRQVITFVANRFAALDENPGYLMEVLNEQLHDLVASTKTQDTRDGQ